MPASHARCSLGLPCFGASQSSSPFAAADRSRRPLSTAPLLGGDQWPWLHPHPLTPPRRTSLRRWLASTRWRDSLHRADRGRRAPSSGVKQAHATLNRFTLPPRRLPGQGHRGAALPRAPTPSLGPEGFERSGRCVRACTWETKTTARRRPRRAGAGNSLREVKGGGGSAPRPHHALAPLGVAAPSQSHRSPADDLPFVSRVARPPNVLVFVPMVRPGHASPGLPDVVCPSSQTPRSSRRRDAVAASFAIGCPPMASPWLSAPHPSPCGVHCPALSRRLAGSVARIRPHQPLHTPADLPLWPTSAAPCCWPLADLRWCPRTVASTPVSSFLLLHLRREISVRMVEHPTGSLTSTFVRPSLRGVVRARSDRSRDGTSPAGDRRWETEPGPASSPTRPGRSLARPSRRPCGLRWAEPLPPRRRCHTCGESCPGGQPVTQVALDLGGRHA